MRNIKTKEHEPNRPPVGVDEAMRQYQEKEQKLDALPEKKAEDIAQLKIDAEELDRTLPEALALSVEENPDVIAYLKERQLPQWHQISHRIESV